MVVVAMPWMNQIGNQFASTNLVSARQAQNAFQICDSGTGYAGLELVDILHHKGGAADLMAILTLKLLLLELVITSNSSGCASNCVC